MQGAIFDVDGTLLDSMNMWWELVIDFFREHGVELSYEEADKYKDITLEESIPMIMESLGISLGMDELLELFKLRAVSAYENTIPLKKGADKYIRQLHDKGVKIAVATSGYEELCKKAFTRLGVWQYFDARAYSSEVGVNKSNPDIYLLAAKRLGIPPEECVVFEDIAKGISGAKKGGFKTCAIYDDTNADNTEELKQLADKYIKSWEELL